MHDDNSPPETLYHYTTQEGFLGILKSDELWASKIHYMNDAREFELGLNIARQKVDHILADPNSTLDKVKLERMRDEITTIDVVNVFVCSFSAKGDMLSQWRAYSGRSSGFSIGFDTAMLERLGKEYGFILAPCVYAPEQQQQMIIDLIMECETEDINVERVYREGPRLMVAIPMGGTFIEKLTRYASIMKHGTFAEEQEWRLTSKPIGLDHPKYDVRAGVSSPVPFFKLDLSMQGEPLINELIVGPTPRGELAKYAAEALLHRKGLQNFKTRLSETPYRNW
jgi:hypothetical protein